VLHLLYSLFWHKVLYDRGHVSTPEPFQRLVNQGMILGETEYTCFKDEGGAFVSAKDVTEGDEHRPIHRKSRMPLTAERVDPDAVEKQGDAFVLKADPAIRVDSRAHKMSKSRGNVVNPDAIVRDYGADSLRLYEMFMGPLEASKPWSMAGVNGVRNFLDRVWRMILEEKAEDVQLNAAVTDAAPTEEQSRILHKTIKAVTEDTASMSFNTAIARMMEFVNYFTKQSARPKVCMEPFVLLLSPYAPHIAEELWRILGHDQTLAYELWPKYDAALARDEEVEIPVQVKGKLRAKILVPRDIGQQELEERALADPRVQEILAGQQVVKTIVVPGRLVNFVTR
jgi:leucyl-tRNA synthetase